MTLSTDRLRRPRHDDRGRAPARRPPAGLVALVLLAALVSSCTASGADPKQSTGSSASDSASPAPSALKDFYSQKLDWTSCGGGFQCADLTVPLDYAKPSAGTVTVAINRLPASDKKKRIGSLLLNPGGPGGSGLDYARAADRTVTKPLRERFDIVGFDPRGVGKSTPVRCISNAKMDEFLAADGTPDDTQERAKLVSESKQFAHGCEKHSGRLLAHVSTRDVARDMDVLRAVLGDRRLTYIGKSYGTMLGATYAELFPKKVRAEVLDGAIDPSLSADAVNKAQAVGFDDALLAFAKDCLSRSDCPLSGGPQNAVDQVKGLLQQTDSQPLKSNDGREVTQSLAVLGVAAALYDKANGWPTLRVALQRALKNGDGSVLLLLSDFYTDRKSNGSYEGNQNEAIFAVNCVDRPQGKTPDQYAADARSFAQVAPVFGPYLAWSSLPCAYWPVPPEDRPHEVHASGSAPILVVGTRRDPATPYAWAQSLAKQLDSGVLLTYEGDGHTAYAKGDSCVDSAVEKYVITKEPPAAGTDCR